MVVRIERDIVFGRGRVGFSEPSGGMREMELKLDAYLPETATNQLPALIMAFGGAFHRGSKEDDTFRAGDDSDAAGTNTPVAEYCRLFAELGMAAFSVQYRLAQSDPEPGTPLLSEPDRVPMSRINPVRIELGLPPASPRVMAGVMEAAFDDVAASVRFIKAEAARFGVDRERMVLGGFSAGGRCAMYVAFGKRIGVRGVVSISGPLVPADCAAFLARDAEAQGLALPPLLMISGENDLDYVRAFNPEIHRQFMEAERAVAWSTVPHAGHFFPAQSATADGRSVFDVMRDSLHEWGCLPRQ
ncbi:MAG: alpha/beta hydrolase [Hyphomicrobiaceae bacterium]